MPDSVKRVALTIMFGDQKREVTFDELTLSNNFALEAMVKLLVDKKIIEIDELRKTMDQIRKDRYDDPSQQSK